MYIPLPFAQSIIISTIALANLGPLTTKPKTVCSGSVLDYAIEKCIDADNNVRCTKPFLVSKDECYKLEWSTAGALSHTTAEVRDAASGEIVFYRDINGEWKPEKGELVYMDFKPKVWKQGNQTVEYTVKTCGDDNQKMGL